MVRMDSSPGTTRDNTGPGVLTGHRMRIEHEARRLRNELADAWRGGCSMMTIRRIESALLNRWRELERFLPPPEGRPKPD